MAKRLRILEASTAGAAARITVHTCRGQEEEAELRDFGGFFSDVPISVEFATGPTPKILADEQKQIQGVAARVNLL